MSTETLTIGKALTVAGLATGLHRADVDVLP